MRFRHVSHVRKSVPIEFPIKFDAVKSGGSIAYIRGSQVLISLKYNISFSEDTRLWVSDLQMVKCPCWLRQRTSGINIGSEFKGGSRGGTFGRSRCPGGGGSKNIFFQTWSCGMLNRRR